MTLEVRISMAGAEIPGDPRLAPLTALQPPADTAARANAAYVGRGENFDWAMPGCVYGENILPIQNGYTAVSKSTVPTQKPAGLTFLDMQQVNYNGKYNPYTVRLVGLATVAGGGLNNVVIMPAEYIAGTVWWTGGVVGVPESDLRNKLSLATVNGRLLACATTAAHSYTARPALVGIYSGGLTGHLGWVNPSGYPIDDHTVAGIVGLGNYLLMYTYTGQFWYTQLAASDTAPPDFSAVGAGTFTPQGISGDVQDVLATANGVLVYTTTGVWSITQTFNGANPFKANQLPGIPGALSVATSPNTGVHYAHTSAGFYEVSLTGATPVWQHLYRAIMSEVNVSFNRTTKRFNFSNTNVSVGRQLTLHVINGRYVAITQQDNSRIWVMDTHLNRWGVLNHPSVSWVSHNIDTLQWLTTEATMMLVDNAGNITKVSGDNVVYGTRDSLLIIGPVARGRNDRVNSITAVSLPSPTSDLGLQPTVTILGSPDTVESIDSSKPFLSYDHAYRYLGRFSHNYLYVVVEGSFEVSNMVVSLTGSSL